MAFMQISLPKTALKGLWLQSYASLFKKKDSCLYYCNVTPKGTGSCRFWILSFLASLIELTGASPEDTPPITLFFFKYNNKKWLHPFCFALFSNKVINSAANKNINPKSLIVSLTCFVSAERKYSLTLPFTFAVLSHYQAWLNMDQWSPVQTSKRLRGAWKNLLC